MEKSSERIFFMAYLRQLVDGTGAVVNSVWDDISYNSETSTINCVLHDFEGLSDIMKDLEVVCPCKLNIDWKK
jgi:hypothetical protein